MWLNYPNRKPVDLAWGQSQPFLQWGIRAATAGSPQSSVGSHSSFPPTAPVSRWVKATQLYILPCLPTAWVRVSSIDVKTTQSTTKTEQKTQITCFAFPLLIFEIKKESKTYNQYKAKYKQLCLPTPGWASVVLVVKHYIEQRDNQEVDPGVAGCSSVVPPLWFWTLNLLLSPHSWTARRWNHVGGPRSRLQLRSSAGNQRHGQQRSVRLSSVCLCDTVQHQRNESCDTTIESSNLVPLSLTQLNAWSRPTTHRSFVFLSVTWETCDMWHVE